MLTSAHAPSGLHTEELRCIADTHDLETKLSELLDGWRRTGLYRATQPPCRRARGSR